MGKKSYRLQIDLTNDEKRILLDGLSDIVGGSTHRELVVSALDTYRRIVKGLKEGYSLYMDKPDADRREILIPRQSIIQEENKS